MPKAPSASTSKTATKSAKTKTSKEPKEKRPPSAYNVFVAERMKTWKADNPGANAKDAMRAVSVMWASAEENPNRGKPPKSKKAKTPKNDAPMSSSQPVSDEHEIPSSDSV
ncbi:hypothetical protein FB446DRAFT_747879 [Lentinula raphanica]|uniref:HMG box domain-containing protein n=1 Tax=Lentinula raphanica TaxID=153919 RepID=A0AA38NUW2_9AGAR|nr:hypothetical protein C8R42DRAFT_668947 [Lentinula raphanica]KAJ3769451.1 hypothetical protein FB446DRAFT_747879 [Lentinula raphanica]KAJ3831037.1 hypothetical protein F5878DRAFT_729715 [Lentinula raphanica]